MLFLCESTILKIGVFVSAMFEGCCINPIHNLIYAHLTRIIAKDFMTNRIQLNLLLFTVTSCQASCRYIIQYPSSCYCSEKQFLRILQSLLDTLSVTIAYFSFFLWRSLCPEFRTVWDWEYSKTAEGGEERSPMLEGTEVVNINLSVYQALYSHNLMISLYYRAWQIWRLLSRFRLLFLKL